MSAEECCRQYSIKRVTIQHVRADPRKRRQLAEVVDISKYKVFAPV